MELQFTKDLLPEAQSFIDEVINELGAQDAITPAMYGSLTMLAHQYNAFLKAARVVAVLDDITIINSKGVESIHPAFNAMYKAAATVQSYLKDFGLTAKSRATLKAVETDGANPFEEMMASLSEG